VLALVGIHVDLVDGGGDQALQRVADRLVLAGHREHGSVVARIARAVEQCDARHRREGVREAVDDVEATPL
jgi:hypothetical protein